ncbi:FAD-binding oxidoreductase [Subsaximicrobium wynnwilliamsii]|uniref:FAD-binding oxidoreductase n=1 Tax=Subsaximicrobium wynnwilliamsii TaxID=291179 RepID=A0A5C6ZH12_9FLAO|nr:FAD-binding oxidoreductase [Subsaximicrobium wynnwilliamsii]TXD84084.1 FAD-binding oxidoreductase [Subsaximicrobium wynnwilliamsii]TXD88958.1 FAD-binding oxidoreductase [Subsaximicrobium wynnwilliamsii]TXE03796.1 FAD-binding oxidoreductase [Subsaximicrobium wynnwilliamsii]
MKNSAKTIDPQHLKTFAAQLKGKLIFPSDVDYDDARKVYNAMIDKRPGLIAMCEHVDDVIAAVNFGRDHNLLIAIRGGGHNGAGLGVCNDGLVIDLSGIKSVDVDVSNNTVKVGGGTIWNEVDQATHPFGLAVPSGMISSTGVGGLTLGGGVGYLTRKYGLTIDNLLEADMVLADGSFVTVNAKEHKDLFWAIRGGGGNFGVVTSFTFQAHPVKMLIGGPTLWPIEQVEDIMAWYDAFIQEGPEDLTGFLTTMIIPESPFPEALHNKKFCGIIWCYLGEPDKFEAIFKDVLALKPVFAHVGEMSYPALQTMFDGFFPEGLHWYWRADFFNELGPEVSAVHLKFGSAIPTPLSQMHLYPISGAASRVGAEETPWAYRDAKYAGVYLGVDPDPENAAKITDWCKSYYEALHPYSAGGAYSNFMMEEGQERVKASYKHNYERLVKIKTTYDPRNLFRVNQNIKPLEKVSDR